MLARSGCSLGLMQNVVKQPHCLRQPRTLKQARAAGCFFFSFAWPEFGLVNWMALTVWYFTSTAITFAALEHSILKKMPDRFESDFGHAIHQLCLYEYDYTQENIFRLNGKLMMLFASPIAWPLPSCRWVLISGCPNNPARKDQTISLHAHGLAHGQSASEPVNENRCSFIGCKS